MNTALTILFLLLPAYPAFVNAWLEETPLDPILIDSPISVQRPMSDAELKKQLDVLKKVSDPATRSKIVRDIAQSCHKDALSVLDQLLANEKDPSLRADILTAMANLPLRETQPEDLPYIKIERSAANVAEYKKSFNSSYLPEKRAAERLLAPEKQKKLSVPALTVSSITKLQLEYFALRKAPDATRQKKCTEIIAHREHPLVRLEALRTLATCDQLSKGTLATLQKIIATNYIIPGPGAQRTFDHDAIRAAAYMVLVVHADEPAAAATLKKVEPALKTAIADGKHPLLKEYYRQIQLYRNGKTKIVPAPLPPKGQSRTVNFTN